MLPTTMTSGLERLSRLALILAVGLTGCGGLASVDLHKVRWEDATVPGPVCGASGPIHLRNGHAVVRSTRWPSLTAGVAVDEDITYGSPVVHGDLDGDGQDEAALFISCNNGGETTDGNLGYAEVIFTAGSKGPRVIGIVTPRQKTGAYVFPTIVLVTIRRGAVVAHELWYGQNAPNACCPTGRTTTLWRYAHGALRAGVPKVVKAAAPVPGP